MKDEAATKDIQKTPYVLSILRYFQFLGTFDLRFVCFLSRGF